MLRRQTAATYYDPALDSSHAPLPAGSADKAIGVPDHAWTWSNTATAEAAILPF